MIEVVPTPSKEQLQITLSVDAARELLNTLESYDETFGLNWEIKDLLDYLEFGIAELEGNGS